MAGGEDVREKPPELKLINKKMPKLMNVIKSFILFYLSIAIAACGFHPRGDMSLPDKLRLMYLQSGNPYGKFEIAFKKALRNVGVTLADSPQDAPITIKILQTTFTSLPSSVGASSQATVYRVTYTVKMMALDHNGKTLIPERDVSSSSSMIVNAQQVLNSTNQLDTLNQQLQQDVIIQIFGILSSAQAKDAVNAKPHTINTRTPTS